MKVRFCLLTRYTYGLTRIPLASRPNRPRTHFHSPLEPFNARLGHTLNTVEQNLHTNKVSFLEMNNETLFV